MLNNQILGMLERVNTPDWFIANLAVGFTFTQKVWPKEKRVCVTTVVGLGVNRKISFHHSPDSFSRPLKTAEDIARHNRNLSWVVIADYQDMEPSFTDVSIGSLDQELDRLLRESEEQTKISPKQYRLNWWAKCIRYTPNAGEVNV